MSSHPCPALNTDRGYCSRQPFVLDQFLGTTIRFAHRLQDTVRCIPFGQTKNKYPVGFTRLACYLGSQTSVSDDESDLHIIYSSLLPYLHNLYTPNHRAATKVTIRLEILLCLEVLQCRTPPFCLRLRASISHLTYCEVLWSEEQMQRAGGSPQGKSVFLAVCIPWTDVP